MSTPMAPHRRELLDELDAALWTTLETGREAADRHDAIGVADCLRAAWMIEALRRDVRAGVPDDDVTMVLRGVARFASDRAWRDTDVVRTTLEQLPATWDSIRERGGGDGGDA